MLPRMRITGSIFVSVLLVTACSSTPSDNGSNPVDPAGGQANGPANAGSTNPQDDPSLNDAAVRNGLRQEARVVIGHGYIERAIALKEAGRLNEAALEIAEAKRLLPENVEAKIVAQEIAVLLGKTDFQGVTDDMETLYDIKIQALKSNAEDLYNEGRLALSRGDYNRAIADLDLCMTSIRSAPAGVAWNGIDTAASELLQRARDNRVAHEEQERQARQQEAFDRLRQQEAAERDRKQSIVDNLLTKAIDSFGDREYGKAQKLAEEVLELSPKNEKAYEVREASFRAGREKASSDYIAEKSEQFQTWKEYLRELEVPWTGTLTLPDKEAWRATTELRSLRRGLDLTQKTSPEELALRAELQKRTVALPGIEGEESITAIARIIQDFTGLPIIVDAAAEDAVQANASIFDIDFPNKISVRQALDFITEVGGEDVTWTIRHETVLITTNEKARGKPIAYYHDVQDLIMGLTDFTGPRIDRIRLLEELEDDDGGGPFGGQLETQRLVEIEDLANIIQENVSVGTWDEDGVTIEPSQGGILITHSPDVQSAVRDFLEDLRRFNSSLVTIESKFMSVGDSWIQEIGVDFRGSDNTNLTDVTNGLEDMASQGLDNGGTGATGSNAAGPPSAGLFFDDGGDGDFRGRTENFFETALGSALSTVGGMTFQLEFLNDAQVDLVLRAIEKTSKFELVNAQMLSVNNTQRAYVTVVNQKAYIQDFDVEVAQFQAVADPTVNVLHEGVVLDVRPTIHHNRRYLTLEIQPTVAQVVGVRNFSTTLGGNTSPVNFELPELEVQSVNTSAVIPDGGSILLGGLSKIRNVERRAEVPWLANVPLLGFLFKQEGYNDERESLMILIKASITDVREEVRMNLERRN